MQADFVGGNTISKSDIDSIKVMDDWVRNSFSNSICKGQV